MRERASKPALVREDLAPLLLAALALMVVATAAGIINLCGHRIEAAVFDLAAYLFGVYVTVKVIRASAQK